MRNIDTRQLSTLVSLTNTFYVADKFYAEAKESSNNVGLTDTTAMISRGMAYEALAGLCNAIGLYFIQTKDNPNIFCFFNDEGLNIKDDDGNNIEVFMIDALKLSVTFNIYRDTDTDYSKKYLPKMIEALNKFYEKLNVWGITDDINKCAEPKI